MLNKSKTNINLCKTNVNQTITKKRSHQM